MCHSRSFTRAVTLYGRAWWGTEVHPCSGIDTGWAPGSCGQGHSKGRAETKGLLKFKQPGCCEGIFHLFWHLHCQQEWQSVYHSLSLGLREMEIWKGLAGASSQDEPWGLVVWWQMLMNRQGKCCQEEVWRTPRHLNFWCLQDTLLRESAACGESLQARICFGSARRERALQRATRLLILIETYGSEDQGLNPQC